MCGRYRRTTSEEEIARQHNIPIPPPLDLPIIYNIAPTQNVLVIRLNPKTRPLANDAAGRQRCAGRRSAGIWAFRAGNVSRLCRSLSKEPAHEQTR
jgi:putative SOS response-associated peptidase YedK